MWKHSLTERCLLAFHHRLTPPLVALAALACLLTPGLLPAGFCLAALLAVCLLCQRGAQPDAGAWHFVPPWRQAMTCMRGAAIDEQLLLTDAPVVVGACMPLKAEQRLALQAEGSGLLLATAAALTIDLAQEDAAPLRAALAPLGFAPETLRRRWQVLRQTEDGGLRGVVVRDGKSRRAFFLGEAAVLARRCTQVWTGRARHLAEAERKALLAEAASAWQAEDAHDALPHTLAYAMADWTEDGPGEMVYLGKIAFSRVYSADGLHALNALLDSGLPVCLVKADGRVQSQPDDGRLLPQCQDADHFLHIAYDENRQAADFPLCMAPDAPGDRGFADILLALREHWQQQRCALPLALAVLLAPMLSCGLMDPSPWLMLLALLPGIAPTALLRQGWRCAFLPRGRRMGVVLSLMAMPLLALAAGWLGGLSGAPAGIAAGCAYAIVHGSIASAAMVRRFCLAGGKAPLLWCLGCGALALTAVMLSCGFPYLAGAFGALLGALHALGTARGL